MAVLLAIPIFIGLLMLQTGVVESLQLLHGSADILLLALIAWGVQERVPLVLDWALIAGILALIISPLPFLVPLIGYLAVTWLARMLSRRVWQTPVLAMAVATFAGTLLYHVLVWSSLFISGVRLPIMESINMVILPSAFLNLILALPMYSFVTDLAQSLYPEEAASEPAN